LQKAFSAIYSRPETASRRILKARPANPDTARLRLDPQRGQPGFEPGSICELRRREPVRLAISEVSVKTPVHDGSLLSDQQKLQNLLDRCAELERTVEKQQAAIKQLSERVRKIEEPLSGY
jgi:hypothetical protein